MNHATAGRIGAHVRWGRTPDRQAATAPARKAAADRWLTEVRTEFPDITDEKVLAQLADSRRRAHMTRIAKLPRKPRTARRRDAA